jgi:hypothetical protein
MNAVNQRTDLNMSHPGTGKVHQKGWYIQSINYTDVCYSGESFAVSMYLPITCENGMLRSITEGGSQDEFKCASNCLRCSESAFAKRAKPLEPRPTRAFILRSSSASLICLASAAWL